MCVIYHHPPTRSQEYFALEDCLGENDRDFRVCKPAMEALKRCSDEQRVRPCVSGDACNWCSSSMCVCVHDGGLTIRRVALPPVPNPTQLKKSAAAKAAAVATGARAGSSSDVAQNGKGSKPR